MAEEKAVETAAKGGKNVFTQKLGPLPVWVWAIAAVAIFYYVQRNKGAGTTAGQQTDPAGNTGTINPATGYVYGSPEDQAAAGAATGALGTGSSSTSGSTTAGQYQDNTAWANAAINYLVGIGVDPTVANTAIQQFLASQTLTTEQQADVNLAIQRIGAPPDPPSPSNAPPPVVTPPTGGSTVYASNPPTGLTVTSVSSSHVGLKWNRVTNAKGYTVSWGTTSAANDHSSTLGSTSLTTTVGNLKPDTHYYFRVQATPTKSGAPFASTSKTTSKGASTGGGGGGKPKYTEVTVVKWTTKPGVPWNSTLSTIADHYHVKGGYQELAKLNHISNPNLIYPGQKIKVPVS